MCHNPAVEIVEVESHGLPLVSEGPCKPGHWINNTISQ